MFMRATNQILDAALETLKIVNNMCHVLVSQAARCVENDNSNHNRNLVYPANIMSKFIIIFT